MSGALPSSFISRDTFHSLPFLDHFPGIDFAVLRLKAYLARMPSLKACGSSSNSQPSATSHDAPAPVHVSTATATPAIQRPPYVESAATSAAATTAGAGGSTGDDERDDDVQLAIALSLSMQQ